MADNWHQVREIFDSALNRAPDERNEYVHKACGEDKSLLAEVESLLSSLGSADSFLEEPAVARVADLIETKKLEKGTSFGHYEIIDAIGAGGMGEVYLAFDSKLERQVALKVLRDKAADDDESIRRFIQEAKAASALNHPNILTVYEIGEFENCRYIATEFIKGITLRERMNGEHFKLGESFEIVLQVAAALSAAHEAGIIHRDIKPENIMLRGDGLVKVLDFGLAKLSHPEAESHAATLAQINTEPGMLMGTAAYMSPEQARGRKLDARSDIFSLGTVMFELFTGKRPFLGESHLDLISSILRDDAPALRQIAPDLPRQLERIVDKSLRKDRDHRYQHVRDLHIDIEDLRDELKLEETLNRTLETIRSTSVTATGAQDVKPTLTASISTTRRFTLLHAIIFAVVAAGFVAAVWFFRSGSNNAPVPGSYKVSDVASWNSAPGELFSNANFSPDGKLIAFSSTKSGTKNIWVTQTNSTEAIQVTNDSFSNTDPIWSPKGDEIAFFSERGGTSEGNSGVTGIWRVSALGGTPRLVGAISERGMKIRRWTQLGKIYYQLSGELYAMEISNGTTQIVTALNQPVSVLSWINISADEKAIAYATQSDGAWKIVVSDLAGQKINEVASGNGKIEGWAWLPEKNRFFYGAAVGGIQQIFMSEIGTGSSVQVTSSDTDSSVVDASPDGKSLIFSSAKEESNLWLVRVKDSQESVLSRDLNANLWPAAAPDNSKIVFQSVKNLSNGNKLLESGIVAKTIKPGEDRDRPALLAESGFLPAWSPDGSMIAFMKKNGNGADLVSVNPNGGGEKPLTTGGIQLAGYSVSPYNHIQTKSFAWSPDSSTIAYVSSRNGASNIWTVGLQGTDVVLTDNTDPDTTYYCPIWSENGKRLAFFFHKKKRDENGKICGLKLFDTETAKTTDVFESAKTIRLLGWTPDETGLIIAEPDKLSSLPPETVLKRIAVSGGTEIIISNLKNAYFYNIFLSDDRKYIAYAARSDGKDDIWVIPSTGGQAKKLTGNNDSQVYFSRLSWFHDGSAIVFGKQTRFSLLSMITDIN